MERMTIKITGTGPILMHSDRMVNRFDPLARKMALVHGKKKKTDEDHEQMARIEWEAGMYFDDSTGPYLPGRMFKSALVGAAKKTKDGPKVKSGLLVMTDKAPLEYDGPRTIEKMWKDGRFADARSVVVQRARIMRCRPIFHSWSAAFEVIFDPGVIDRADVVRIAETCGTMVGIGDYRPEKGGDFGRFNMEVLK
jgi:hypothetical protein